MRGGAHRVWARALCLIALVNLSGCTPSERVGAGPVVVQVRVGDEFAFVPNVLRCRPGEQVRIQLVSTSTTAASKLPHTLVVLRKGADVESFAAATLQATAENQYVPAGFAGDVIAASLVVESGQRTDITFTSPMEPGEYPIVCSFPGHCMLGMRGLLTVDGNSTSVASK